MESIHHVKSLVFIEFVFTNIKKTLKIFCRIFVRIWLKENYYVSEIMIKTKNPTPYQKSILNIFTNFNPKWTLIYRGEGEPFFGQSIIVVQHQRSIDVRCLRGKKYSLSKGTHISNCSSLVIYRVTNRKSNQFIILFTFKKQYEVISVLPEELENQVIFF